MPNFEQFHKRATPEQDSTVTIQRRGAISLSRASWLFLACPANVVLLFDRAERIMGIKAASRTDPDAYPIRPQGTDNTEFAKSFVFSGKGFTKFYGIEVAYAQRWPATLTGDVLCVNLSEPGDRVNTAKVMAPE